MADIWKWVNYRNNDNFSPLPGHGNFYKLG